MATEAAPAPEVALDVVQAEEAEEERLNGLSKAFDVKCV